MKKVFFLLSLLSIFLNTSCQQEEIQIEQPTSPTGTLTANSQLVDLIERVTQNPTSLDNILDNSSCFSVVLPVTVIVNGQNITVNNQSDYQIVQNAINQFSNDDDIVNFIYPITIRFQNFQTIVLNNSDALDDVLDDCQEDDELDEIDCIQVVYPVSINVYNTSLQLAETVVIQTNAQLFNFLNNLNSNQLIAVQYPITIINSNGQNVVVQNNTQLLELIDDSIDDCDDNSGSGGGGNNDFINVLTNGTWRITYFFDDQDETANYSSYNFTFNTNNTVIVTSTSSTITGTWSNYLDSGNSKLNLIFDGIVLDEIEEDWQIIEHTSSLIRLKNISGGNGGTDYLTFSKN